MNSAELENQIDGVRQSFFRAMTGQAGSTADELGRTVNGLRSLRQAGAVVDADTLWGPKDYGRCLPTALPIWRAVAGAVVGIGAE